MVQVYTPATRAKDEEIEEIFVGIEELLKLTKPHHNITIIEDFNTTERKKSVSMDQI